MARDREAILERVIEIVAETLDIDASELNEDTDFESLDADSLDLLELVTAFEDEFALRIADDQLQDIKSIRQSVDLILNA